MSGETLFLPADEAPHEPGTSPLQSESLYYNFVDGSGGIAGLIRVGNRINEGRAELTVLLFLPDGAAAFHYAKPPISEQTFDLDGLRAEIIEPLRRSKVSYDGEAHLFEDGLALLDPSRAFAESPVGRVALSLEFEDSMPVSGWKEGHDGSLDRDGAFALNHYEALCGVSGTIEIEDDRYEIEGRGFRDHSWGPRQWAGPNYYRWVSCSNASGDGFVVWMLNVSGEHRVWGFVRTDGITSAIEDARISTRYSEKTLLPEATSVEIVTGDKRFAVEGRRTALVPLRHRGPDAVARIAEIVFEFDRFNGSPATGVAEFHDLMIDGRPAGMGDA